MKLSRRKFMEALAAAGMISVAPPLTASPSQAPPAPLAPPSRSPSGPRLTQHFDPAWDDDEPLVTAKATVSESLSISPSGTDVSYSMSRSVSPSETASASPSTTPSWSYSLSASPSPSLGPPEHPWYGHELVYDQKTGRSAAVSLDPEDARKALEAYEKLGGEMGDVLDETIRRIYRDVLRTRQ